MAQTYDNSGIIFRNDRKEKPNHPDAKGSCTIGGVEYWISGWIKEGQKGKFTSLSFKPKEEAQASADSGAPAGGPDLSDEIPFAPLRELP